MDLPWPVVVEAAAGKKQLEFIQDAMLIALEGENPERYVGDVVGISDTTDTALRLMSRFRNDRMTPDLISELSELQDDYTNVSPVEAIKFINWASRLGIVCRDEEGYRLDSTYAEGLSQVFAT